ncbi:PAS domain S-box protein [Microcoleus sp. FACHB-831]|uniref:CheR family methyltransferase n=1 Tax=Microcoleus sp. FACHB-831 TaxID=2692827 RepID=UPI0016892278|nr:CheR family methyltransferase [Microcoleus sp. FACHB-831]MBD1921363.1 PAS domain S-box protein [Microcoleus sp. FACHB-831]
MTISNLNPEFETLLDYLKRSRGFDFTGYKRSTLMRRVNKRMQTVEIDTYSSYVDYLEVHPDEYIHLFNTLLINVTSFFRDRSTWDYLKEEIIPLIVARKQLHEPIRVWSAACASGEEAYTIAMVIAEVLGLEQFRERVKIYATELDEEALLQARQAIYSYKDLANIPQEMLEKYFEPYEVINVNQTAPAEVENSWELQPGRVTPRYYTFRKDLRRSVIFGRHNLTVDAPIPRVDLLVCRNTLMYFNAETQSKIVARFHFALNEQGFLFLGKAEMLLTYTNTFTPVDLKRRVFSKVAKISMRDRLLLMAQTDDRDLASTLSERTRILEAAFDSSPVAQVIVDVNGFLVLANTIARGMFNLNANDVGRPLQDLEISYRPLELRSCIEQAYSERRVVNLKDIQVKTLSGDTIYLEVQFTPLQEFNTNLLGIAISFTDVTRYKRLQEDLQQSNQELEMAYEELQATNEELETTNEELQSSNEELETTNEELQSSNEELETMNEELQSTNEELQAVNDEMRRRSEELNQVNAFLESILTSLRGGVVVVDRDFHVQIWNYKAQDLWGLRSEEVQGQHFLNLDIGLPVEELRQLIRGCLVGEYSYHYIMLDAINRRGRTIQCKVSCTPLLGINTEIRGAILVMDEQNGDSE